MFGRGFRLGKPRRQPQVWEGAVYRHCGPSQRVETALVLKLTQEQSDIPHVQYILEIERTNGGGFERSVRTLNLTDFRKQFGEPITEAPHLDTF